MKKIFIADDNFERVFERDLAKGHKRFIISDDIEVTDSVELVTEGTDLVMKKNEDAEGEEVYMILCKEFGMTGLLAGFKSKVSIIHIGNGWMLVTLHYGALIVNLKDQLMMPSVGEDFTPPKVVVEDILWVDANHLLEYGKYFNEKERFMYDVEFMLQLGGDNPNNMKSFSFRHFKEEDIDISLGCLAQYEQNLIKKEEARSAKKLVNNIINKPSSIEYDFDDEDVEDDEDEMYDDEDDDDYDDYDDY